MVSTTWAVSSAQAQLVHDELKNHGLGQVQIQARADRKLREFMFSREKQI